MCLPLRKACLTHCVFIQIFKIYKQNSQQQIVEYAPEEIKKKQTKHTKKQSIYTSHSLYAFHEENSARKAPEQT